MESAECEICLERPREPHNRLVAKFRCSHSMCRSCFRQIRRQSRRCPFCRSALRLYRNATYEREDAEFLADERVIAARMTADTVIRLHSETGLCYECEARTPPDELERKRTERAIAAPIELLPGRETMRHGGPGGREERTLWCERCLDRRGVYTNLFIAYRDENTARGRRERELSDSE